VTNLISIFFGFLCGLKFPKFIQIRLNRAYVRHFAIDMSEFEGAESYKSLNSLFTRRLKFNRTIPAAPAFISPSDGVIFECGQSRDFKAFSIKNRDYDLCELVDENLSQNLDYFNIYLSPKDYHHYHAPCDLQILSATYIPAKLYSVAKKWLFKVPNLYAKNERVVLKCQLKNGKFLWLVFVGALNVGKMKFDFDENIQTNAFGRRKFKKNYENLHLKIGEHLGNFELGSTIVILNEIGAIESEISPNLSLKFGQILGRVK